MCCRLQVALHPEWTIVACVLLTLLSCIGIVNFSPKSDTLSLWIPETSVRNNVIVASYPIQVTAHAPGYLIFIHFVETAAR